MAGFDAYLHLLRLVSLPGVGLRLALTSESSLLDLMLTLIAPLPLRHVFAYNRANACEKTFLSQLL